jgi:hypothetical protein
MGKDPGTQSTAVTGSGDPDEIRSEIESTRQELGDTVAALSAKTDVKAQAKQKVEDTKATVADKKDELLGKAGEAPPLNATTAASRAVDQARRNPVPLAAAGAFAFGFLTGRATKR